VKTTPRRFYRFIKGLLVPDLEELRPALAQILRQPEGLHVGEVAAGHAYNGICQAARRRALHAMSWAVCQARDREAGAA